MFRWYRRRRQTFTSYLAIILIAELVLIFSGVIRINFTFDNLSVNPGVIAGMIILAFIAIGELWEW